MTLNPDNAKSAYPELEESIRRVFQQHDPSGFFAMGAPKDERDDSIHAIIARLQYVRRRDGGRS